MGWIFVHTTETPLFLREQLLKSVNFYLYVLEKRDTLSSEHFIRIVFFSYPIQIPGGLYTSSTAKARSSLLL